LPRSKEGSSQQVSALNEELETYKGELAQTRAELKTSTERMNELAELLEKMKAEFSDKETSLLSSQADREKELQSQLELAEVCEIV
jgi:uncharacterized membrane-anchored protein YhcB (DUF1043 family)